MGRTSKPNSRTRLAGENLNRILESVPVEMARLLMQNARGGDRSLLELPDQFDDEEQSARDGLLDFVADQDREVLVQLERICSDVAELGHGKGITSLKTTAHKKLRWDALDEFEQQPDELCRSLWTYVQHSTVFQDAQSFHSARRHRDHGRLYSAFEIEIAEGKDHSADDLDLDAFCRNATDVLELKVQPSATALDLPKTETHPPSVMVALRHGGSLSSIQDHRADGRSTIYYRPANEAIFIYTPSLRKLEVCSDSFVVRNETSKIFASVLLGQDLSTKPLTKRNYNLDRFRRSLFLPLPDLDYVEIAFANVIELQMRLGGWSRVLTLKVAKDDEIEHWANRFIKSGRQAASQYGYSKIAIAVGYVFRSEKATGTLNISVTSSNASNVLSATDPKLRSLGQRLLEYWGVLEHFQAFEVEELGKYFNELIELYDLPKEEVTGAFLDAAGMDRSRLVSASMIEKKGRQDVILIDENDGAVEEGEVLTGDEPGTVRIDGAFGEDLGTHPESEFLRYRIGREWLSETVLRALKQELGARHAKIVDDHVAEFGLVDVAQNLILIYLVRSLTEPDVVQKLDLWFRRRQENGFGLVLTTSDVEQQYLGSNVVVPLRSVVDLSGDQIVLDPDALDRAFVAGRFLAGGGDKPQVVRTQSGAATLFVPGKPPLRLGGEHQAGLFEKLVAAAISGQRDVKTGVLMKALGSSSPQHLFKTAKWDSIRNQYLCNPNPGYWRLCSEQSEPV